MAGGWRELGEGVFVRRYAFLDQNIGVVLGDDAALVIDSRSTGAQADELRHDLRELTSAPIRAVVNTHWHDDHTFGNHRLRPAELWGHERCAQRLATDGERMKRSLARQHPELAGELADLVVDPPERTFSEQGLPSIGGRRIRLEHLGRGHTDSDVVVSVPGTGVLFAGDLVEHGAPPNFGDAYPLDWPETVSRMLELVHGPVVPGHGDVVDRSFVDDQLGELLAVAELGHRVHRGELALEAAAARGPFGQEASRQPIARAAAQLRGELDPS